MGASGLTIVRRHLAPHVTSMMIAYSPLNAASAVAFEATLSYLSAGINPPTASLGNMISDGQAAISYAPMLRDRARPGDHGADAGVPAGRRGRQGLQSRPEETLVARALIRRLVFGADRGGRRRRAGLPARVRGARRSRQGDRAAGAEPGRAGQHPGSAAPEPAADRAVRRLLRQPAAGQPRHLLHPAPVGRLADRPAAADHGRARAGRRRRRGDHRRHARDPGHAVRPGQGPGQRHQPDAARHPDLRARPAPAARLRLPARASRRSPAAPARRSSCCPR